MRLGLIASLIWLLAGANASAQEIDVEGNGLLDFGSVLLGPVEAEANSSKIQREVSLKNLSDQLTRITYARSSCGCLKVLSYPSQIKPGEQESLSIALDTAHLTGPVRQFIFLGTVDGEVEIGVHATVQGVWTNPSKLDFGAASARKKSKRFVVCSSLMPDLQIVDITSDNPRFEVSTFGVSEDTRVVKSKDGRFVGGVLVEWQGGTASPGPIMGEVSIQVASPDYENTLKLPLVILASGGKDCVPAIVNFGAVQSGSTAERKCKIRLTRKSIDLSDMDSLSINSGGEKVKGDFTILEKEDEIIVNFFLVATASDSPTGLFEGSFFLMQGEKTICGVPYVGFEIK